MDEIDLIALQDFQKQASRAAEPGEVIEADAAEFGEGDGEKREINAGDGKTKGEAADHQPSSNAERDGEPQPDPWTDAVVAVKRRRRVGTDAEIERVAKGKLTGEAHKNIPGLAGVGEK